MAADSHSDAGVADWSVCHLKQQFLMAAPPNPSRELLRVVGQWQKRLQGEEGIFKVDNSYILIFFQGIFKVGLDTSYILIFCSGYFVAGKDATQLGFCRPELSWHCHQAAGNKGGEFFSIMSESVNNLFFKIKKIVKMFQVLWQFD